MFDQFKPLMADPILHLMKQYRADPRPEKIDVGVGVFKNEQGETPIMRAVSIAEERLLASQTTKSYVGLQGNLAFNQAMIDLIFSDDIDKSRLCAIQTPGGSGALRICGDMLAKSTDKTIWVSDPTWGNHTPIFQAAGLDVKTYPYLHRQNIKVDEDRMLDALAKLGKKDVVLLHGCCHNPTGANLSNEAWDRLAELACEKGFFPFFDLAYQGFGDGLDADLYGLRKVASNVPELIVTSSCSKNFGLYRERVGCAIVMGANQYDAEMAQGYLASAGRVAYSMPPNHGAETVSIILNDASLRSIWEEELNEMRERILFLRKELATCLSELSQSDKWNVVAQHRGMFSLLCLDKAITDKLVNEYAIYIVDGGRVNIAGLKDKAEVQRFAECLSEATKTQW